MVCRGEALRAGQSGRYGVGDGRTGRYAERANGADERLRSEAGEPARLFAAWFAEAKRSEPVNPDAMALATVGPDGMPNARMVLMKGFDERGFVFYTNTDSIKGHELAGSPKAALTFYWKALQRQVRARGTVEPVTKEEADTYFASRS